MHEMMFNLGFSAGLVVGDLSRVYMFQSYLVDLFIALFYLSKSCSFDGYIFSLASHLI